MDVSSLRGKFKNNFVKPLYRRINHKRVKPKYFTSVNVNRTFNLDGTEINVKKKILCDSNKGNSTVIKERHIIDDYHFVPGTSEKINLRTSRIKGINDYPSSILVCDEKRHKFVMSDKEYLNSDEAVKKNGEKNTKLVQAEGDGLKIPGRWLRVYPLPKQPNESICSVFLRSLFCQLGLATILILWTIIWVFTIHSFEGPYEKQVSLEFEQEQDQLVIDLATELRQITPISEKWKAIIVRRIEEERRLTMMAMARGAKIHPGQFWDLSGTFLFTIYVMTALVVNLSTCVIVHTEAKLKTCRKKLIHCDSSVTNKLYHTKDSHNGSRNSEVMKLSNKNICKNLRSFLSLLCACQCLPLAIVSYYVCGVLAFGVLRKKSPMETALFSLEFTTTGGLEQVERYVLILYGFYVEGAMMLLAFTLENLRRHSSAAIDTLAKKYRLFEEENIRN